MVHEPEDHWALAHLAANQTNYMTLSCQATEPSEGKQTVSTAKAMFESPC